MTREEIKSFTLRTTEANACELIVILYDVILTDTKNARSAFEREDFNAFRNDLNHAAKFLNELFVVSISTFLFQVILQAFMLT